MLEKSALSPSRRDALQRLYEQYKTPLWRYAMSILHDEHAADDVLQTVFEKIIEKYDMISTLNCNKLHSYIVIMVRNTCYSHYRECKKHPLQDIDILAGTMPDLCATPEETLVERCEQEEVMQKKEQLKTSYQDVLTMKYCYRYTDAEIADVLGIKEGSVRVTLHRALTSLRRMYEEEK